MFFKKVTEDVAKNIKHDTLKEFSPIFRLLGAAIGMYIIFSDDLKKPVKDPQQPQVINNIIILKGEEEYGIRTN